MMKKTGIYEDFQGQTQVGLLLLSKVKLFPSKVTDGKFYVGLQLTIRSS